MENQLVRPDEKILIQNFYSNKSFESLKPLIIFYRKKFSNTAALRVYNTFVEYELNITLEQIQQFIDDMDSNTES